MKVKEGEKILIKINGKEIETVIVEGVQRLPYNSLLRDLCVARLNDIWIAKARGKYTEEEVRFLYQNIGYSVCGYHEVFEEDEIENPLWEEDEIENPLWEE